MQRDLTSNNANAADFKKKYLNALNDIERLQNELNMKIQNLRSLENRIKTLEADKKRVMEEISVFKKTISEQKVQLEASRQEKKSTQSNIFMQKASPGLMSASDISQFKDDLVNLQKIQ